jgi:hypothetical protein
MCVCMPQQIARGVLMDGSGETASTPKIVSDDAGVSLADRPVTMRPPRGRPHRRELAFRLLYIRRPGAGVRRLFTPGRKGGGLVEKARGDIRIRGGHCKFEKGCRLFRQVFFSRHNTGSPLHYPSRCTRCDYALRRNPFRRKCTKVNLAAGAPRTIERPALFRGDGGPMGTGGGASSGRQSSPRSLPVSL